MPRKYQKGANRSLSLQEDQPFVVIAKHGDVLLEVYDQEVGTKHHYQCSRAVLRNASNYFDVLFDQRKFSEGIAIEAKLQELRQQHHGPAPASRLPSVSFPDLGEFPKASIPANTVFRLCLEILHDPGIAWPTAVGRAQSINLVALLAIVADRFGAHALIAAYLRRQTLDVSLLKDRRDATTHDRELENRQRLLAGIIFGFPQWVLQCSAALIINGSKRWTTTSSDLSALENQNGDNALWWRLPSGVEDEIISRREYVLETLSSIQKHFIALYASRQPQCRLGYGSSPKCDSYQLGEIIRFFSRKGLLRIESAFATTPNEEAEPYSGSIEDLVARFRECTSYQIDEFHQHCGLRTKLMPILETLWPLNQVWICLDCWKRDKSEESWLENPRGGKWTFVKKMRISSGCQAHMDAKAMYTATTRDWTPD